MYSSNSQPGLVAVLCAAGLLASHASAQETLVISALQEQVAANESSRLAQAQIDRLSDETAELLAEYRAAVQSLDRVRVYNDHLQTIVDDQEREKTGIDDQLERFGAVEQEIVPLMLRMIADLEQFIELDLPFQIGERRERVAGLRSLMDRADVSISEKYRRIMEAYTLEANFGRNIEAYQDWLENGGDRQEVDFLRVGRIFLGYQSRDRSSAGFWNAEAGAWQPLDDAYRRFVTEGLRIARKQAAPNLLTLPVAAPRDADR